MAQVQFRTTRNYVISIKQKPRHAKVWNLAISMFKRDTMAIYIQFSQKKKIKYHYISLSSSNMFEGY